jgi:hypothetical protein
MLKSAPNPVSPALLEAPGRIVDIAYVRCGTKSRPAQCMIPTVEYHVDGRAHRLTSRVRYRSSPMKVGDPMPVLHAPADPRTAWIKSEYEDPVAATRKERWASWVWAAIWSFIALWGAVLVVGGWRMSVATHEG